jgi:hypothetical protein
MAAGLVVPIAGPFVGTYHAFPLGTLNDDGYVLTATVQGQEVNESDAYGMTLVEGIYRGVNWRCRIRGLEWNKTGLLALLQMFGQGAGGIPDGTKLAPALGNIGDRWTAYAFPLVLTAILGNPPTTPQTLTATNAALAPQQATEMMLTSKLREMPLDLVLLPYLSGGSSGYAIPFSTT